MNNSWTTHEQVTVVIMRQTKLLFWAGMIYGGWGWFPTAVRIRLSQPPAGDWQAGAWAELGKKWIFEQFPVFLAAMSNSKRDN